MKRWPRSPKNSPVQMNLNGLSRIEYKIYGIQRFVMWLIKGFLPRYSKVWTWCKDWLEYSWWRKFFKGLGWDKKQG